MQNQYHRRHIATRSPPSSSKEIGSALLAKGTYVNPMTVSRNPSNESGLKSNKTAPRPHLTPAMKFQCLYFAKKYEDWTAKQWGTALLSNESLVHQLVMCTRHEKRPPVKKI